MSDISEDAEQWADVFRVHWQTAIADRNMTLYGFRRFKTTHLLNLRFLEDEIAHTDREIYQAGLSLNLNPSANDRLGLRHSKRDRDVPKIGKVVNKDLVARLRDLLQRYDEAIFAFNKIMSMDTFSLLDDGQHTSARNDLTLLEMHKTRLLRVDLGPRSRVDPVQVQIRKGLRAFRFWRLERKLLSSNSVDVLEAFPTGFKCSYQDTTLLATILSRIIAVLVTGSFLVVPLAILSRQQAKSFQLAVVTIFILAFAFLAATLFKVSNLELMVVSAAYSAVLSVFVSNIATT